MSENTNINTWDGLLKNYLKADNMEANEEALACVGVTIENGELELQLERKKDDKIEKFVFGMNVTNKVFLKNSQVHAPKEVIGKILTFKKVLVQNPQTRKEVEGLRICKVE